jgi:ABC-type multidrug transport system fused ATPase/permease subunit
MISVTKKIFEILGVSKSVFICMIALSLVTSATAMIAPWIEKMLLNNAIGDKNIPLWQFLSIVYVSVILIRTVWLRISGVISLKCEQIIDKTGQLVIMRKILFLTKKQMDEEDVGGIMQKMNTDFRRYIAFLKSVVLNYTQNIFTYVLAVILLFSNGWIVGVLGILLSPIFAASFFLNSKKVVELGKSLAEKYGRISSFVQEKISGQEFIKLQNSEELEVGKLEQLYSDVNSTAVKEFKARIIPVMVSFLSSASITVLIYVIGSFFIMKGEFTVGALVASASWIMLIGAPVNNIASTYLNFNAAIGAIERSNSILDAETDENRATAFQAAESERGFEDISFSNVSFSYGENRAIDGVSVTFRKGGRYALVGESGSGKSTVLRLILSLYTNYTGSIKIGGTELRSIDLSATRRHIGVISQSITIWNDTVRNNLLYANELKYSDDDLWDALEKCGISAKVRTMNGGLDAECGENGNVFSGGERQRIAMARLLLKNPDIVLLDEATSAVDARSEREILKAVSSAFRDKTIIIVTHRITGVTDVDGIVLLKNGKLIAEGTHGELLGNSEYYSLYQHCLATSSPPNNMK